MKIFETEEVVFYLKKRKLIKQYKKVKEYLLENQFQKIKFKQRKPLKEKIFQFRINKQFRAFGFFDKDGDFVVFKIDNHQN